MNGSRDYDKDQQGAGEPAEPGLDPGEAGSSGAEPLDPESFRRDTNPEDISVKIDVDGSPIDQAPIDEDEMLKALGDMPRDTIPSQTDLDPRLGTLLDDRYLLLSSLGEGGMGTVYQARHVLMDKPVAIKLIHAELAHIADITKRFEREARSSSRLSDPHCITVTDFGSAEDGSLFLVMELLDGESLADRLERDGKLPVADALRIAGQILKGLAHAHDQGVVHRDLKPENVMLVTHGDEIDFVKILDFGIAKLASGSAGESLTRSGVVFGTPKYLSPEQALGDEVDHRADLYAVGVIIYEMLVGKTPYAADTAMDTLSLHLTADIPRLADSGKYPRGLQEVIDHALAKKPAERFADAEEFLAAVEAVDPQGAAPSTTTVVIDKLAGKGAGLRTTSKKSRRWPVLFALLLLLLVAGGLYYLWRGVRTVDDESFLGGREAAALGDNAAKVEALLKKAEDQIGIGKPAEAVITVKEALRITPDLASAMILLGHAQFLSGERVDALDTYEQALRTKPEVGGDVRLGENLAKGLEWEPCRAKAASLLALYGGAEGVATLASRANSALTPIEIRQATRAALVDSDHADAVDWLTSLTADFNDTKKCKEAIEIVSEMERVGDPRFLPLLEAHKPTAKASSAFRKSLSACIGAAVTKAIATLTEIKERGDAGPRAEADDESEGDGG